MTVEEHIKSLLFKHSCIVVPEFGTFFAHTSPAQHEKAEHLLFPPTKEVSFNGKLSQNDGLLVSRLSRAEAKPYSDSLQEVQEVAEHWNAKLEHGEPVALDGLGTIHNNSDKIAFNPAAEQNYLLSSFGLAPTNAVPVDRGIIKPEDSNKIRFAPPVERKLELTTAEEIEDENEDLKWLPFLKYASIILLIVSIVITAYYFYNQDAKSKALIAQEANDIVNDEIKNAVFYEKTPLELPPLEIEVEKKFHVVAGAFRVKKNAEKKIEDLRHEGYNAHYIGRNQFQLHQVAYASFETNDEALVFLEKVDEVAPDAWILEE